MTDDYINANKLTRECKHHPNIYSEGYALVLFFSQVHAQKPKG